MCCAVLAGGGSNNTNGLSIDTHALYTHARIYTHMCTRMIPTALVPRGARQRGRTADGRAGARHVEGTQRVLKRVLCTSPRTTYCSGVLSPVLRAHRCSGAVEPWHARSIHALARAQAQTPTKGYSQVVRTYSQGSQVRGTYSRGTPSHGVLSGYSWGTHTPGSSPRRRRCARACSDRKGTHGVLIGY